MARDGGQAAADAGSHPVCSGCDQVFEVFEGRETHAHANGIDDAVHPLVEIRILLQEQPQAEQLGRFFRDGGAEEGLPQSVAEGMDFLREQAQVQGGNGEEERTQHGQAAVEETLHDEADGLPLELILLVGIEQQYHGRQNGQGDNVKHSR